MSRLGKFQPWKRGPAEIVEFPRYPVRAIIVQKLREGVWFAQFSGDQWTPRFYTNKGGRWLVLDAIKHRRQGLPIVDHGASRFPYPPTHSPALPNDGRAA